MIDIETLHDRLIADANDADTLDRLESVRVGALGKQGSVTALLKTLGGMTPEQRQAEGPRIHSLREAISAAIGGRKATLEQEQLDARLASEKLDLTLPVDLAPPGTVHTRTEHDKGHGRIERRTTSVAREVDWLTGEHRFPGELRLPGVARVVRQAIKHLSHVDRVHLSFDLDVLDPEIAPGVGTPVRGGLTYREGHLLMELLSESGRVTSLDIVEVNPVLDTRNQTAEVMVGMAASLLGQRIL